MVFSSPYDALKEIWGYPSFRPLQEDIIKNVLSGLDTLAILPTGGGKSLCFQVPALCLEGICIVVTPIIALMKDQVEQLKSLGVNATAIYSGMTSREIDIILDNCVYGQVKFLYVSPERLKTALFIERTKKMDVDLLAIDEAHCISQWGYDFRPSYLEIKEFKKYVPNSKIVALTATATREVTKDIIQQLEFRVDHKVFIQSFARPNLSFIVRKTEDKEKKLLEVIKNVKGSGIIYARTRKRTKEIAEFLIKKGISANYYHAGLTYEERTAKQDSWMKNKFRFMIATNAFGMGINKTDVRIVIHLDPPDNIESYYQEAGRAGRDGEKAYAVFIYHEKDKDDLINRIKTSSPEPAFIKRVYQSLANYYKIAVGSSLLTSYDFEISDFAKTYQLDYLESFHAMKKLEEQGFLQFTDSFYHPSRIMVTLNHEELYKFQVANRSLEPVIKAILRLYGGEIYSNFMNISEKKIAAVLKTSLPDIERKLDIMNKQEVIIYDKKKDQPQITFTTARYDANKLPLDTEFLNKRRESDMDKAKAVVQYIAQDQICRSVFIRNYFGENRAGNCGICDICAKKYSRKSSVKDRESIRKTIFLAIREQPRSIQDLIEKIRETEKEIVFEILQEMLDSEEIYYDEKGWLFSTGTRN